MLRVGSFPLLAVCLGAASSLCAQQPAPSPSVGSRVYVRRIQPNTASLLADSDVRSELGLSDEQVRKVDDILDDLQRPRRPAESERAKKQGYFDEIENRLKKVLNEVQRRRLGQLSIQVQGPVMVLRPDIAKSLQLTDVQRKRIVGIVKSAPARPGPARPGFRALPKEEQQKALDDWWAVRKELDAEILKTLTVEQRASFAKRTGEEFEFPGPRVDCH